MSDELRMIVEQVTEKEVTKKDARDKIVKQKCWTSKLSAYNTNTDEYTTVTISEDADESSFMIGDEWNLKKSKAQKKLGAE